MQVPHRLTILLFALVVAAVLAILQQFAFAYYLYWVYWWFDLVMHGIGGVVIGLCVYALGFKTFIRLVGAVLVVGLVWEGYEQLIGALRYEQNVLFDTLLDLAMDTLGALGAYGIIRWWEPTSLSPLSTAPAASPDQTSS